MATLWYSGGDEGLVRHGRPEHDQHLLGQHQPEDDGAAADGRLRQVRPAGQRQGHVATHRGGEGAQPQLRLRRLHVPQGRRACHEEAQR